MQMSDDKTRKIKNTNVGNAAMVTEKDSDSDWKEDEGAEDSNDSSEVALEGCEETVENVPLRELGHKILGWYEIDLETDIDLLEDWKRRQNNKKIKSEQWELEIRSENVQNRRQEMNKLKQEEKKWCKYSGNWYDDKTEELESKESYFECEVGCPDTNKNVRKRGDTMDSNEE